MKVAHGHWLLKKKKKQQIGIVFLILILLNIDINHCFPCVNIT